MKLVTTAVVTNYRNVVFFGKVINFQYVPDVLVLQSGSYLPYYILSKKRYLLKDPFFFIMGFDWGIQELNIKESNNYRRLITGILGGFGLFSI